MLFKFIKLKIKQVLGEDTSYKLAFFISRSRLQLLRVLATSNFCTKFFIVFCSKQYDREILSVLRGQITHYENEKGYEAVNYSLRRGVHRLEKGLSMQPMRNVFGLNYIHKTVSAYKYSVEAQESMHKEELKWAHDVLDEYFKKAGKHSIIQKAKEVFLSTVHPAFDITSIAEARIPYPKSKAVMHSVSYEEFYKLSLSRRSVRWFQQRHVPREIIDQAISAASLSPSACNRQPFVLKVIDEDKMLNQVRSLPIGIKGFAENIPVMIAVIGKLRAYTEVRDRHAIYVDGGLVSMSLMYAFETLGLSTCPINWPDIWEREDQAARILSLGKDERIVMWIAVGYGAEDGLIPQSVKVSLKHIREYN